MLCEYSDCRYLRYAQWSFECLYQARELDGRLCVSEARQVGWFTRTRESRVAGLLIGLAWTSGCACFRRQPVASRRALE